MGQEICMDGFIPGSLDITAEQAIDYLFCGELPPCLVIVDGEGIPKRIEGPREISFDDLSGTIARPCED